MKSGNLIHRTFGKLSGLWLVFAVTLVIVAIGLALLSRHALRLNSQQTSNQQRERVQQSVRLALWRLDSRLAPYIATLHQKQRGPGTPTDQDLFVQSRFQIFRNPDPSIDDSQHQLIQQLSESDANDSGDQTTEPRDEARVNNALIQAIKELIPAKEKGVAVQAEQPRPDRQVAQSKSQRYSSSLRGSGANNQRQSRAKVVQQQVELNAIPQAASNLSVDHFESDFRMVSLWVGDRLAIVRPQAEGRGGLEGVWVDWPALHQSLISDIDDVLPKAKIRPVGENETVDPEFALASLPAMIVPGRGSAIVSSWSPTHTALLLSWAAFAVSALIAGISLSRLVALSERRADFVSAVTHELRTPLTTFRLYSDLLARDMVTDPADRRSYLETLRREADRLTHLVDNVLRYSRLERTSKPAEPETVIVSDWIERVTPRLRTRLQDAEMTLAVAQSGDGEWRTDPQAMEQVLFNLIDNAAKYASTAKDRRVHLDIVVGEREVAFTVADHGDGVPMSLRDSMFDPFSKSAERAAETAAGVGLGLALVKRTIRALGGSIDYGSNGKQGAKFVVKIPSR